MATKTKTGIGRKTLSSSTLIGDSVVSRRGEDLGRIEELMIDPEEGRVSYAVVSVGGLLGMGDKLLAIPMQALHLSRGDKSFILDVDEEKLKNAPGFDKDNWPDMADTQWGSTIHSYYGRTPYWDESTRIR